MAKGNGVSKSNRKATGRTRGVGGKFTGKVSKKKR